eukprot:363836-Chlamydomonas_euryale.AAC.4
MGPGWAVQLNRMGPGWAVQLNRMGPGWAVQLNCMCPGWAVQLNRMCPGWAVQLNHMGRAGALSQVRAAPRAAPLAIVPSRGWHENVACKCSRGVLKCAWASRGADSKGFAQLS